MIRKSELVKYFLSEKNVSSMLGCIGCVWCVIWFLFVKSDPQDHPFISDEELAHIKSSSCSPKPSGYQSKGVPWCSILSSYRVWALIVAKFCGNWAYLNIAIKLPAYLEQVLHVPISKVRREVSKSLKSLLWTDLSPFRMAFSTRYSIWASA